MCRAVPCRLIIIATSLLHWQVYYVFIVAVNNFIILLLLLASHRFIIPQVLIFVLPAYNKFYVLRVADMQISCCCCILTHIERTALNICEETKKFTREKSKKVIRLT